MLQLQPGERKVIKAAGEVDISTQYLRNIYVSIYLSIYAGRVWVRVVPAPRAQQQPGLGTQGPRHRPDGGHLHTAGGQVHTSQYLMLMTILTSTHRQGSHGGSARPAGPRVPLHPPGGRGRVRLQVGRYLYFSTSVISRLDL